MAYQIIKNSELIRQFGRIAAVKSRIVIPSSKKTLVYHKTVLDTGSDTSVISKSIANRLDMEIDKKFFFEIISDLD